MRSAAFSICLFLTLPVLADEGHSKHGTAFDSGMRTKPWVMQGIGSSPFRITTKNPEVQKWYDQANALLHSFWFEEAERSLRWCHKLEPENPMVYLGLAQTGMNWFSIGRRDPQMKRYFDFLAEATKRKSAASERERMYIDAWNAGWNSKDNNAKRLCEALERIVAKYPDDIEAKAQLAFYSIEGNQKRSYELIDQVLAAKPKHTGAHPGRLHNSEGLDKHKAR